MNDDKRNTGRGGCRVQKREKVGKETTQERNRDCDEVCDGRDAKI